MNGDERPTQHMKSYFWDTLLGFDFTGADNQTPER